MDLVLWRHAQALDLVPGEADLDRLLTAKGERQAQKMAVWLDRHLPDGVRIISSPARRCELTAKALGRKYKIFSALTPDATPQALLELAKWPRSKATTLVVGHQPTLGRAIAQLLQLPESECVVGKGAVWWLRCRESEGVSQTVVVTVQVPDML